MMSVSSLDARLNALAESIKRTLMQIQQLSKANKTPTTSSPSESLDTWSLDVNRAELSADIHETLKQQEEDLEVLCQDVEDFESFSTAGGQDSSGEVGTTLKQREITARVMNGTCLKVREDLKNARRRFRTAQLRSKDQVELASQKDRAAYLSGLQMAALTSNSEAEAEKGLPEPSKDMLFIGRRNARRDPNATQDDVMLSTTSDITSSLRRTHALLTSELSRSRFAHETLESSNQALKELNERYTSLDDMLTKSRGLLKTLLSSKKTDQWCLQTARTILLITIAWIFFRKIIYGPAWWFLYLPLKLLYSFLLWVLSVCSIITTRPLQSSAAGDLSTTTWKNAASGSPTSISTVLLETNLDEGTAAISEYPNLEASLSDEMGQMIDTIVTRTEQAQATTTGEATEENHSEEDASRQEQGAGQAGQQRGDGEKLPERDPERNPPNPKKRMMEEPPRAVDHSKDKQRDEL